ncbi:MAG: hypothetical protein ACJAS7_000520 [Alpinimonas sp.]
MATAARRSSVVREAGKSTRAELVARLTAAVTPGSCERLFSTRATQLEHVIPSISRTTVDSVAAVISVPSFERYNTHLSKTIPAVQPTLRKT